MALLGITENGDRKGDSVRLAINLARQSTTCVIVTFSLLCLPLPADAVEHEGKPNIIFIMADDLGYADLGCYGQQAIATPHLDALAAEGMRFTSCYSGSPVCAPARSVLMTGRHTGHTTVRGNFGQGGVKGLGGGNGRGTFGRSQVGIIDPEEGANRALPSW